MALIKCPECEREISNQAIACPYCGLPIIKDTRSYKQIKRRYTSIYIKIIIVFLLIICSIFIVWFTVGIINKNYNPYYIEFSDDYIYRERLLEISAESRSLILNGIPDIIDYFNSLNFKEFVYLGAIGDKYNDKSLNMPETKDGINKENLRAAEIVMTFKKIIAEIAQVNINSECKLIKIGDNFSWAVLVKEQDILRIKAAIEEARDYYYIKSVDIE